MKIKLIIYIVNTIIIFFALDGININQIFKKNKIIQARIFYFILALSLVYLLTNFIWDFCEYSKIIKNV